MAPTVSFASLHLPDGAVPGRILVSGGNGYLGSEIIRQYLALGAEVHAIVNQNSEKLDQMLPPTSIHRIASDFTAVEALVRELEPDAILHLAAVHAEPPTFDQMMGMLNCSLLLGVALLHGAASCIRKPVFVHAGTYWQFDGGVFNPNTFYAAAKHALHDLLIYYRRAHGVPSLTLVLYDIFGPNDTRPKLWSRLRDAAPATQFPTSEGRQLIEAVHVSDIARGFIHATSMLLQGVPLEPFYALRSGVRITLRQLLEEVQRRAPLPISFEWGAIPYWPGQIFEPWQGPMLPGWRPLVQPTDGITALVRGKDAYAEAAQGVQVS